MESIFSKPPASPSHHYATLLQKKERGNKSSEYFSRAITPTAHLYTTAGLAKGHRRAVSIPQKINHNSDLMNGQLESSGSYEFGSSDDICVLKEEVRILKTSNISLNSKVKELEKLLEDERKRVRLLENKFKF